MMQQCGTWHPSENDVEYVDIATPVLGDDGTPKKELSVGDGLHLNARGYELWTSILKPCPSWASADRELPK